MASHAAHLAKPAGDVTEETHQPEVVYVSVQTKDEGISRSVILLSSRVYERVFGGANGASTPTLFLLAFDVREKGMALARVSRSEVLYIP